jgi:electron transfer flavoprotein alpha subunit
VSRGLSAVWIWFEGDLDCAVEAVDLGEALGVGVHAVCFDGDAPDKLADVGVGETFLFQDVGSYDAETHTTALLDCLSGTAPLAVLLPCSANGADLAPRLAARLGAACLLDCARLRPAKGSGLEVERWAHDDRAQERWLVPEGLPLVATKRARTRGPLRRRPRPLKLVRRRAPALRPRSRLLRRVEVDPRSTRLGDAERIVAAGLGIGGRDLLPAVLELADHLGAALGASRPLADRGWVPFERQIGTTGQAVAPRLYVAVGISGAMQHTAGIKGVDTLVAINRDPACPMMGRATLAVVGDARELVPALNRRLAAREDPA